MIIVVTAVRSRYSDALSRCRQSQSGAAPPQPLSEESAAAVSAVSGGFGPLQVSPSASRRRHHFDTVARDTSSCSATGSRGSACCDPLDHDPPTGRGESGVTVRHRGAGVRVGLQQAPYCLGGSPHLRIPTVGNLSESCS